MHLIEQQPHFWELYQDDSNYYLSIAIDMSSVVSCWDIKLTENENKNKMQQITRKYRMSDGTLVQLSDDLLGSAQRDTVQLADLGFTDEAQTAGAILGYNYQGSPFYDDAFRLLTGAGLSPEATGDSWLNQVYRQVIRGEWL